jgi:hypothetical protein
MGVQSQERIIRQQRNILAGTDEPGSLVKDRTKNEA